IGQSCHVSTGPRQASCPALSNGITASRDHDDRDGLGCTRGCMESAGTLRHDYVNGQPNELGRKFGQTFVAAARPTPFEHKVPAFEVTQLAQALDNGIELKVVGAGQSRSGREKADAK